MTSDLPRSRAVVRAPAASLGAMRTTCSPRRSRKRFSAPETWRQSSSAHTRSASRPRAQTRRSSNARRRALTVLSPISRPVAASTAATVCDCLWVSAPITIIYHRPLVGSSDEQIDTTQWGRCHASIKSRRRSSDGGARHNIRRSDRLVDRKSTSQPVAGPRTYRPRRTPPPDARKSRTEKVKSSRRWCSFLRWSVVGAGD